MYNVVFPTNFSTENKEVVTEFINQFTPKLNVDINYYLVHAYQMPSVGQHVMLNIDDNLEANAKEDMQSYMNDIRENIPANIHLHEYIREGSFEAVLHKFDKEIEINLVVISQTKKSPYKEVLQEKNLSYLSETLGEPIVFIPSIHKYVIPHKVVFATDLKPFENDKDFKNFLGFIKNSGAYLEFIHINTNGDDSCNKKFEDIYGHLLREYQLEESPLVIINSKEINKSIITFLEEEKPEMIAMIERQGGFFDRMFNTQSVDVIQEYNKLPIFVMNEKLDQTKRVK